MKCIEDEIPFEVPEGWAWCRLNKLFNVCSAKRVRQSDWREEGVPFYRAREIVKLSDNGFVENELFISEEHYIRVKEECGVPQSGDLMVSGVGTIGKIYIVNETDCFYYKDASVLCFENRTGIVNSEFARILLESSFLQTQMKDNSKGTTVDTITISAAMNYLCLLPPLKEQENIVQAVKNACIYAEEIQNNKDNLQILISKTKSKILDLAIRGQLVPQSPDDEPASVLLERIRAEKEELIKAGKIKRDKKESTIFKGEDNSYYEKVGKVIKNIDNEIPFTIPDSWKWCRLKTICKKIVDGSHNPPKGLDFVTPYIMASSRNIIENTISDLSNVRYLNKENFIKEHSRTNVKINDILLTTVATLGRSCIYKGKPENLCFQRSVTVITSCILPTYLKLFFDAPYFQNIIVKSATGTAQKGFYLNQLENVLICIPPLAEQDKISCGISSIFYYLDLIEKSLN